MDHAGCGRFGGPHTPDCDSPSEEMVNRPSIFVRLPDWALRELRMRVMVKRGRSGRSGQRPIRRSNRRALKVGAAASIVLTFSPGLVAANAAPAVVLRPPANPDPQTVPDDDDDTAESEFRTVIRAARHALSEARDAANKAFRVAVAPHRRALDAAVVAAESNSERRAARVQYGQAILPAKIERKTAMQAAKVGYIDAVEQARIDFLAARGAAHDARLGEVSPCREHVDGGIPARTSCGPSGHSRLRARRCVRRMVIPPAVQQIATQRRRGNGQHPKLPASSDPRSARACHPIGRK